MSQLMELLRPAVADTTFIDIWIWSLVPPPEEIDRLSKILSEDEKARAQRFVSPAHGAMHVAGRGRLREILADYTNRSPESLRFTYGLFGKPMLIEHAEGPCFNLSHTGDLAALAIAGDCPVGLDIETVRPMHEDLARRFFSTAEIADLENYPPEARLEAFYRCWTRKEAFVKATGDGLGTPLNAFDVTFDNGSTASLRRVDGLTADELAHWRLLPLEAERLPSDVVGAVAVKAKSLDARVMLRFPKASWTL